MLVRSCPYYIQRKTNSSVIIITDGTYKYYLDTTHIDPDTVSSIIDCDCLFSMKFGTTTAKNSLLIYAIVRGHYVKFEAKQYDPDTVVQVDTTDLSNDALKEIITTLCSKINTLQKENNILKDTNKYLHTPTQTTNLSDCYKEQMHWFGGISGGH